MTVVDKDSTVIRNITSMYDVMGIVGNGASYGTLKEADIEHADLLIAVSRSDELNLLCCVIAHQAAKCHTIARVRNSVYREEREFIRRELGLSMIINPEFAAAQEMARLLRFYRIDANDSLSLLATPKTASGFFRKIGVKTNQVHSTMIVGGGETTYYLAAILLRMGIHVTIIEKNRERCEVLSEHLQDATIICGDGSDQELLKEENLENMESFVACTDMDEENIILSLYAKDKVSKKVVTKINHLNFNDVIHSLNLDSLVYPKYITAETILQYVRAMKNSMGSNVETLYKLMDDRVEALEFIIRENCPLQNITLESMKTKKNVLVACINRRGRIIIPGGQDSFRAGDSVIVVTTHTGLENIEDILDEK